MKLKITPQNTNDEIGHTDYKPEKYQLLTVKSKVFTEKQQQKSKLLTVKLKRLTDTKN